VRPTKPSALVLALAATLVAALPAATSSAAGPCTKVASPLGSDTASGSESDPFRSVQRLADSLSAGQTGCLRAGTYEGNVRLSRPGAPGAPLTIARYPGEKAIVKGRIAVMREADHVTFEGLYLDGTNGGRLPSPTVHADDVTFRRNDVTNHHTGICFALGDAGGTWGRAARNVIELNRIHDCGRLPATNLDHGIYVNGADGAVIRRNWIYDNADYGVVLYPDARDSAVTGNVIDGNGMGVLFSGDGGLSSSGNLVSGNVISNSTVRSNVEEWWGDGSSPGQGNLLRRNCLHVAPGGRDWDRNGGVALTQGGFKAQENVVADPEFVDRQGKDLRLESSSPCRTNFSGGDETPGPDPLPPLRPRRPAPSPAVVLTVATRAVEENRPVGMVGRVAGKRPRRRSRARIQVRKRGRWRTVARARIRRNGRFSVRARLRVGGRAKVVRVRAVVRAVGRSRTVRVRVRR
jgi:hypothetical protein